MREFSHRETYALSALRYASALVSTKKAAIKMDGPLRLNEIIEDIVAGSPADGFFFKVPYPTLPQRPAIPAALEGWVRVEGDQPQAELSRKIPLVQLDPESEDFRVAVSAAKKRLGLDMLRPNEEGRVDEAPRRELLRQNDELCVLVRFEDDPLRSERFAAWKATSFYGEKPEELMLWVREVFSPTQTPGPVSSRKHATASVQSSWEAVPARVIALKSLSDSERESVWSRLGEPDFPILDEPEPELSFKADALRPELLGEFAKKFKSWQQEVKRLERVRSAYRKLSDMQERERDSNMRSEIVFGDYRLKASHPAEVDYPVLVARVRVVQASPENDQDDVPYLEVRPFGGGESSILQTDAFRAVGEHNETELTKWEVEENGAQRLPSLHEDPQRTQTVKQAARRVKPDCIWSGPDAPAVPGEHGTSVVLSHAPVIFLRDREIGLADAVDKMIKAVEKGKVRIPEHFLTAVSGYEKDSSDRIEHQELTDVERMRAASGIDDDFLFAKAANEDQIRIARLLDQTDGVVVQGPPGTGKTHTIANLITHHLSKGNRILVASSKSGPLEVIREKLPKTMRSLCVSWLDDMAENQNALIDFIKRLDELDHNRIARDVEKLTKERKELLAAQRRLETKIVANLRKDVAPFAINGESYSLARLAKELHEQVHLKDAVPGPIVCEGPLPLSWEDISCLCETHGRWVGDHPELSNPLPRTEDLPLPGTVREWDAAQIKGKDAELSFETVEGDQNTPLIRALLPSGGIWEMPTENIGEFVKCMDGAESAVYRFDDEKRPWERVALLAGYDPQEPMGMLVEEAIDRIEAMAADYRELTAKLHGHDFEGNLEIIFTPEFDECLAWADQQSPGAFTGRLSRFLNGLKLKRLESVKVDGQPPHSPEARALLRHKIDLENKLKDFKTRWTKYYAPELRLPVWEEAQSLSFADLKTRYARSLRDAYGWKKKWIDPTIDRWKALGVDIDKLAPDRDYLIASERYELFEKISGELHSLLAELALIRGGQLADRSRKAALEKLEELMRGCGLALSKDDDGPFVSHVDNLRIGLRSDPNLYELAYEELRELEQTERPAYRKRRAVLVKLQGKADAWVRVFENHAPLPDIYEDFDYRTWQKAWDYAQKAEVYKANAGDDLDALLEQSKTLHDRILEKTAELASAKAWSAVRPDRNKMGALRMVGENLKRIGKGKGAKAEQYRSTARELLADGVEAVPVWVMPIANAITQFDASNPFDLVIIDEASQAEMKLLPIMLLGKKMLIVGDSNQVSPMSTNDDPDAKTARERYLDGVSGGETRFTASYSLYDLAYAYFPNVLLTEHFRCVPDIIGFSSRLSYNGKITPLRPAESTNLKTPLVLERVEGERDNKDCNEVEADRIGRLIKGMLQQEEYADKTFGVIVMRTGAGHQKDLINQKILEYVPTPLKLEHKIRVGTSSDFQGDERDVILLSLVDSVRFDPEKPDDRLFLNMESDRSDDMFKKRWNVAVSRARDQLWVVHSFDWEHELKDGDIRRRLFDHIVHLHDAKAIKQKAKDNADPNSLHFEAPVAEALMLRGYRVDQQFRVGGYKLDMVIKGEGKARVALECDGQEFHSSDEQIYRDMVRQAVLERAGWTFIRLSGREYFLDPEKAVDRVCADLAKLGIHPVGSDSMASPTTDELPNRVRVAAVDDEHPLSVRRSADADTRKKSAPKAAAATDSVKTARGEGLKPVVSPKAKTVPDKGTVPSEKPVVRVSTKADKASKKTSTAKVARKKTEPTARPVQPSLFADAVPAAESTAMPSDQTQKKEAPTRNWAEIHNRPNTPEESERALRCREWLREIHELTGWTYATVAEKLGISTGYVGLILYGDEVRPSARLDVKIGALRAAVRKRADAGKGMDRLRVSVPAQKRSKAKTELAKRPTKGAAPSPGNTEGKPRVNSAAKTSEKPGAKSSVKPQPKATPKREPKTMSAAQLSPVQSAKAGVEAFLPAIQSFADAFKARDPDRNYSKLEQTSTKVALWLYCPNLAELKPEIEELKGTMQTAGGVCRAVRTRSRHFGGETAWWITVEPS